MATKNSNMSKAKTEKNDEFYTRSTDIEKELRNYKDKFEGKVILCNCDDPRVSNFFKYFVLKFNQFGLKEVIATCYKNQDADLFTKKDSEQAVYLSVTQKSLEKLKKKNGGRLSVESFKDIEAKPLKGDGDFRSPECVEFLKKADIVCTNPPFSLFREYVALLMEYEKKFLIIGNKNAITYKEIFPLIQSNKLWIGCTPMGKDLLFDVPDDVAEDLKKNGKEGSNYIISEEGKVLGRSSSTWFTNIDHGNRHKPLDLYKKFNPKDFPKYDNYDAIEVPKVESIPLDYEGVMGVPISFLDKYCPEQFEIIGISKSPIGNHLRTKIYDKQVQHSLVKGTERLSSVTKLNDGAAIECQGRPSKYPFYEVDGKNYIAVYPRILIKNIAIDHKDNENEDRT